VAHRRRAPHAQHPSGTRFARTNSRAPSSARRWEAADFARRPRAPVATAAARSSENARYAAASRSSLRRTRRRTRPQKTRCRARSRMRPADSQDAERRARPSPRSDAPVVSDGACAGRSSVAPRGPRMTPRRRTLLCSRTGAINWLALIQRHDAHLRPPPPPLDAYGSTRTREDLQNRG